MVVAFKTARKYLFSRRTPVKVSGFFETSQLRYTFCSEDSLGTGLDWVYTEFWATLCLRIHADKFLKGKVKVNWPVFFLGGGGRGGEEVPVNMEYMNCSLFGLISVILSFWYNLYVNLV